MSDSSNLYWDSNIFIAYLANEHIAYDVESIEHYLQEAKGGKKKIYSSSLSITEILPNRIKRKDSEQFLDFVEAFQGHIILTDPIPAILELAAKLRNFSYRKNGNARKLDTPDAIHLATFLHLQDDWNVKFEAFHTFDNGHRKSLEGGKGMPLLSFQDWCEGLQNDPLVSKVIQMPRKKPELPSLKLIANA